MGWYRLLPSFSTSEVPRKYRCLVTGQQARSLESSSEGSSGLDRHRRNAIWCDLFDRILVGRASASALLSIGRGPSVGVVRLPTWVWVAPRVDVGRRLSTPECSLPVRIIWFRRPQVILVKAGDAHHALHWNADGLGHSLSGVLHIPQLSRWGADDSYQIDGQRHGTTRARAQLLSRRCAVSQLKEWVDDGIGARWVALGQLEAFARNILPKVQARVEMEINDGVEKRLFDESDIDPIINKIILGDGSMGDKCSRSISLIEKCLKPDSFARCDPQRLITVAVFRDVEEGLRNFIGDPHAGRKIRSIARGRIFDDIREIVDAYTACYPSEKLGVRRATAALTVPLTDHKAYPASHLIDGLIDTRCADAN